MRLEALRLMRLAAAVPAAADRQRHDRPRPQGLRHRHARLQRQPRAGHRPARTGRLPVRRWNASRSSSTARARVFTHVHVYDRFNFELTVYAEDKAHYVFKSSITGKAIERASIRELEELLRQRVSRDLNLEEELASRAEAARPLSRSSACCCCRWRTSSRLAAYHPEGDVLYHSLAGLRAGAATTGPTMRSSCWPPCCTMSAKGSTAANHVEAGLEALEGLITERTRFLIEHHMDAHDYRTGQARGRGRGANWRRRRTSTT